MKIAFTTSGADLSAPLDPRFGRAQKFLIYDTDAKTFDVVDNAQNLNAAQGAGIQAAQRIIAAGAQALVSGHCGPKAFHVLNTAGVKVYTSDAKTVDEALKLYQDGKLAESAAPNVGGHWS